MGIEVITTEQSAWQYPYAERLIGSVRRECLDHPLARLRRGAIGRRVEDTCGVSR